MDPADAFERLVGRPGLCWLDSALRRPGDGRFSILTCAPRWVFRARRGQWEWRHGDGRCDRGSDGALEKLETLLQAGGVRPASVAPDLPFWGGAIGWLAYDLGYGFEKIGEPATRSGAPDVHLAWYDCALVWDHEVDALWLVGSHGDRNPADAAAELRRWVGGGAGREPAVGVATTAVSARSNMSRKLYEDSVRRVRAGIARGEYYQLNLVQRFTCPATEHPARTYLRLRTGNPAPFGAFLSTADFAVLASSPERLVEVTPGGDIRSCPIKGTRRRGNTVAEDVRLRGELLSCEKERAELLMIVDLARNDLGRLCVPGTIRVPRLHSIESYATVHHLVGEVRGRLRPDVGYMDVLRAVFPAASITGAPKVSAMREIQRLEPDPRGIAMGSLGYFSAHGRIDLNIAIRTIVVERDSAHVAVGAGIVWDSDPAREYDETLVKARALFAALGATPCEQ